MMLKEKTGSFSLVLERPFSPFPIQQLLLSNDLEILFNRGRVPIATWKKEILASNLQTSDESSGNSGFAAFSSKFLTSEGWKLLRDQNEDTKSHIQRNILAPQIGQLVGIFTEDEPGDGEWAHGSFPLDEYVKALERSKGELYYDHSRGMSYSKVGFHGGIWYYVLIIFSDIFESIICQYTDRVYSPPTHMLYIAWC